MVQIRESFIWGRLFFCFTSFGTAIENQQPKFLESAAAGYETSFYNGSFNTASKQQGAGYHANGTCGALGIVLAAANMFDYPEDQTKNAFCYRMFRQPVC